MHFSTSNLATDSQVLKDLGIIRNPADFGYDYFDVSGSAVSTRSSNNFENAIINRFGPSPSSIQGWLMRGAIREDDYISGPNPWIVDPDLPIPFVRVFNHFFDPVNRRGLTVGVTLGDMAPQWAIGSVDVFNQPNTPNPNRKNHYTVFDAREAMYRALTGQDKNGNPVAATEADRKKYWATTFRSLGDVVHLLGTSINPVKFHLPSSSFIF